MRLLSCSWHRHEWQANDNVSVGEIQVETDTPTAGQVIQIGDGMYGSGYGSSDTVQCTAPDCSFYYGEAYNDTEIVSWEATTNGSSTGTFGWFAGGLFVAKQPADPWEQVTHWKAPASVPVGGLAVTLRKTIDDNPEAMDPELNELVATYDDAAETGSRNLTVVRHQHNWGAFSEGLNQPTVGVSSYNPPANGVIQLSKSFTEPDIDLGLRLRTGVPRRAVRRHVYRRPGGAEDRALRQGRQLHLCPGRREPHGVFRLGRHAGERLVL